MKIYILNAPYIRKFSRSMRWQGVGRGGTIYYPIWLAYAAAILEQCHQIRFLDAPARDWGMDSVIADIRHFKPRMIVLDSSFTSWQSDVRAAEAIKKDFNEAVIVMVGPPAAHLAALFLANPAVDVVVRGEFDFALRELADALKKGSGYTGIGGISYKAGAERFDNPGREPTSSSDLDALPFVSGIYKKYLNMRDYFMSSALYPEVQIMAGRGCSYRCSFCAWPQVFTGRKVRMRSVGNFIEEIEWIRGNLRQVKEIVIEDDTFTLDRVWLRQFCDEMIARNISIVWSCQARADLDYEILKKMKAAGCRKIITGFESGSDNILGNINKGLTAGQMKIFAKDVKKSGIFLQGDFVIGLPGENSHTIRMTRDFINDIKPEILQISIGVPYPGTAYYDWARSRGYLVEDDPCRYLDRRGYQRSVVSYPDLSCAEIAKAADSILKKYYISLSYAFLFLKQICGKNGFSELLRFIRAVNRFFKYLYSRH